MKVLDGFLRHRTINLTWIDIASNIDWLLCGWFDYICRRVFGTGRWVLSNTLVKTACNIKSPVLAAVTQRSWRQLTIIILIYTVLLRFFIVYFTRQKVCFSYSLNSRVTLLLLLYKLTGETRRGTSTQWMYDVDHQSVGRCPHGDCPGANQERHRME